MSDFIQKLENLLKGFGNFFSILEGTLHKQFLGIEFYNIFAFAMIVCIALLLYLLLASRNNRTRKMLTELEQRFDGFKEEINIQLASLKLQKTIPQSASEVPDSTIKEEKIIGMLETVRKTPKTAKEKDEDTSVRAVKSTKQASEEDEIVRGKDSLFEGLDDVSNPFFKPEDQVNKQEASKSEPKPPQPKKEMPVIVGNADVSWNAKTALKSKDGEMDKEEVVADSLKIDLNIDQEKIPDKTGIDFIDKNIEVGSDEISISFDEEPHKALSNNGVLEERRASQRVPQEAGNIELVYEGFTDFINECSLNISTGGLFVKGSKIYPVGTKLNFNVRLKDGYKLLKGEAEVTRIDSEPSKQGMGLKFLNLDEDSKSLVDRIISQNKA
jgi:uncharacterized protein (TIGR02266 family)